jgi:hypothetical protein
MRWLACALMAIVLAACGSDQQAPGSRADASPTSGGVTPAARPGASPHPGAPPGEPAIPLPPIYSSRGHGYDVSYPQCTGARSAPRAGFSIVGLNDGKAFTANPCFQAEWKASAWPRAVYLNSGYLPDNSSRTTAQCRQLSQYQQTSEEGRAAFAIGCSEARLSLAALGSQGATDAAMIWIDVEIANSWDPVRMDLNRLALQAEIYQLNAYGRPVGVYSTAALWQQIVGQWSPDGVVADWVAGAPGLTACAGAGFSGHSVWLVQELATWPGLGIDSDWAC